MPVDWKIWIFMRGICRRFVYWLSFKLPIMENQMGKKVKHEMETWPMYRDLVR